MYLRHGDISWDHQDGSDAGAVTALSSKTVHLAANRKRASLRGNNRLPSIELCNVKLHRVTEAESIKYIMSELDAGRGGVVVTPNLDHLRRCVRDRLFGSLVAEAELVVADGMPLVWASRLQGTPLPERVAGSNLISSVSKAAAERGKSIFLLGGAEGTAVGAAEILRKRHPELKIVGTYCPQIGFESKPKQMAEIVQMLTAANPDIVFVALGSPKQEHLITKLRPALQSAWWLGVGVSFSFFNRACEAGSIMDAEVGRGMAASAEPGTAAVVQALHRLRRSVRGIAVDPVRYPGHSRAVVWNPGDPARFKHRIGRSARK